MNSKTMLSVAIMEATLGFNGVYDKGGNPYILHCFAVMHKLRTKDDELRQIAILHDIIEDCKYTKMTYKRLVELGFSDRVIDAVRCLSKVPGETYEEYKDKVKSNIDAILVKMADLQHNSDVRRLKGITQKDQERIAKYHQFHMELEQIVSARLHQK